ncbi:MAG: metallophosphoesterase [Acidobacteriota bacterium]
MFKQKIRRLICKSEVIDIDNSSKIIIFSDIHRGHGDRSDDFFHNQDTYINAMKQYNKEKFTYIELGDGDELWENANFWIIKERYRTIFELFDHFHKDGRFHFIWGNHNRRWKNQKRVEKELTSIIDEKTGNEVKILKGIRSKETMILRFNSDDSKKLLLIHGHQGEILNDSLWWFGRFFVRIFWGFSQLWFGIADPTSPAKNYKIRRKIDKRFMKVANDNKMAVVIGHTHFPIFPDPGEVPYFNDGSCVHPRCITGLEIIEGKISLIKWSYDQKDEGYLSLNKKVLAGPEKIDNIFDFFKQN